MCLLFSYGSCSWLFIFFFFKQKTAYEMLSGDWSSDVCSSDLAGAGGGVVLNWLGTVDVTAEGLLERRRRPDELKPGEQARLFLEELLAAGPLTAQEVWQRVRERGLSVETVKRAKR